MMNNDKKEFDVFKVIYKLEKVVYELIDNEKDGVLVYYDEESKMGISFNDFEDSYTLEIVYFDDEKEEEIEEYEIMNIISIEEFNYLISDINSDICEFGNEYVLFSNQDLKISLSDLIERFDDSEDEDGDCDCDEDEDYDWVDFDDIYVEDEFRYEFNYGSVVLGDGEMIVFVKCDEFYEKMEYLIIDLKEEYS